MNILQKFFDKKKATSGVYLGLYLRDSEGIALHFKIEGERKFHIIGQEQFTYTNEWENLTEDIDEVLYRLENKSKFAPNETIFFVYSDLIDREKKEVKKPYFEKIKKITKDLDLQALGYIEAQDALTQHFQSRDTAPLNGIILEFTKKSIGIYVYKGGRHVSGESVVRSDNFIQDITPAFEHIRKQTILPSRIILYASKDLSVESSGIVTHTWREDLFIQIPKIEVIQEHVLIESFIESFAREMTRVESETPHLQNQKKEVMGFVIGDEVQERLQPEYAQIQEPHPEHSGQQNQQVVQKSKGIPSISTIYEKFRKQLKVFIKKTPFPLLPLIGIFLIVLSFFVLEYFFHTAQITLYLPSQDINKKIMVDAVFSTTGKNNLLITENIEKIDIKNSKSTTGKKDVGEKAKGTITIYNSNLSESKTFEKGTAITSSNGVQFTIDDAVKIASASGDASSPSPSTAKVSVVARDIGTEGNLSANTKFNINGESADVIGKNDSAFSGGIKKQITTVSRADIEDLKKKATAEAKNSLSKKVSSRNVSERKFITSITELKTVKEVATAEVGEEASQVELKSEIAITSYSYNDKDMYSILKNELKPEVRPGLTLPEDKIRYQILSAQKTGKKYTIKVNAEAKIAPDIDSNSVALNSAMKTTSGLSNTLKKEYKLTGIEFEIRHPLPFMKNITPLFKKNIKVSILYN